jgi:nucleoside-diphosphate-sugar epimerase
VKRKIVITGISSPIIQKLTARIDLSKYEVIGISRNPSFVLDNVKIVTADIQENQQYSDQLHNCYMVIHGAAITHSKSEKTYFDINLKATIALVEEAKKHSVTRFIFISSNTAGMESGAYGLTKLLAEQHIQKELKQYSIIRLSEVYGGSKKEGIDKLIDDALHKSVLVCPTGMSSKLSPIHIEDTVGQLHNSIFRNAPVGNVSVINGPETFTYQEIIGLIENVTKRKIKVFYFNKNVMYLIKWMVKISPIKFGIVPDQVDRLYSAKHIEDNTTPMKTLSQYLTTRLTMPQSK